QYPVTCPAEGVPHISGPFKILEIPGIDQGFPFLRIKVLLPAVSEYKPASFKDGKLFKFLDGTVAGIPCYRVPEGFHQFAVAAVLALPVDCATLDLHITNVATTVHICKP